MPTVALVGAAHIHTPNFVNKMTSRDDTTVKGVWDHDAERAAKNAEKLGCETAALDALLADDMVDAVVICSETNRHEELVEKACAAGKHLFVEKPLGMGTADARRMLAAIESAGVIFQTGYFQRGSGPAQFIKQHIDAGSFGTVTRVRHSNCHGGVFGGIFDSEWAWMADPAQAGCGAYGDLGTHSLDILLWWMGAVDSVAATIDNFTNKYPAADECGEGIIRFAGGAIGTLAAGWVNQTNPVTMEVSGTEGHAVVVKGELFFKSNMVDGADGKEAWADLPDPMPHAFDLFLDAVDGKDAPLVTPREAAYCGAVMEALYEAAAQQAWVKPAAL